MSITAHKIYNTLAENVHIALSLLLHVLLTVVLGVQVHPVGQVQLQRDDAYASAQPLSVAPVLESIHESSVRKANIRDRRHGTRNIVLPPHSIRKSHSSRIPEHVVPARQKISDILKTIHQPSKESSDSEHGVARRTVGINKWLDRVKSMPSPSSKRGFSKKEMYLLKTRLSECWSIISDTTSGSKPVRINLILDSGGNIMTATIPDTHMYNSNQLFRAVADSALRAVHKCMPFKELLSVDYNLWKEIELTFNPGSSL